MTPRSAGWTVIMAVVGSSWTLTAAAATILAPHNFTTTDSGKDIVLGPTSTWSASFVDNDTFYGQVHSLLGYLSGSGYSDVSWADTTRNSLPGPNVFLGTNASGNSGYIVYKFVVAPGYALTGGTVRAHVSFCGTPSSQGANAWMGVSTNFTANVPSLVGPRSGTTYTAATDGAVVFGGKPYGTYLADYTLDLPAGASTFYVLIADRGASPVFGFNSMTVSASLANAPTPVISPNGGTFTPKQRITITDGDETAVIHYTLDGADPTENSPRYMGPFDLASDTIVTARAWVSGAVSPPAKATFTFSTVNNFVTSGGGKDIVLSSADPSFTTDLGSWDNFTGDAWGILGAYSTSLQTQLKYIPGTADGMGPGVIQINASYAWFTGNVIYKFVTAPGTVTSGGAVSCHAMYRGLWSQGSGITLGIGTGVIYPTNLSCINNYADFIQTDMTTSTDQGYASYYKTMTLSVPAGLDTFYVAVCKGSYPTLFGFDNLSVNVLLQAAPETPVITPAGGAFHLPASLAVTCGTSGAVIHYTTDGSPPTEASATYEGPFVVSDNQTIKARAFSAGIGSVTAAATFAFPTTFNRPIEITPAGNIVVDGNLAEWPAEDFVPLDRVYDGNPTDIAEAAYAAQWDFAANRIYVAVKVRDTDHGFTDTFGTWDTHDDVEIYIHTNGDGPTGYQATQADAQQYIVGLKTDGASVWSVLGNGLTTPDPADFSARGSVSEEWLYYEAALTPYTFFTLGGNDLIPTPLAVGEVIGLDCVVTSASGSGAYLGQMAENSQADKSTDYTALGLHKLATLAGDANADGRVAFGDFSILQNHYGQTVAGNAWAQGDFNGDGAVSFEDFSVLQNHYGQALDTVGQAAGAESGTSLPCGLLGLIFLTFTGLVSLSAHLRKEGQ